MLRTLAVQPFEGRGSDLRVVPPVEDGRTGSRSRTIVSHSPFWGGRRDWVKCEKAGEGQSSLVSNSALPPPTILWRAPGSAAFQVDLLVSMPFNPEPNPAASNILPLNPKSCPGRPVRPFEDPDRVPRAQPQIQARLGEAHPRPGPEPVHDNDGIHVAAGRVSRPIDANTPVNKPPALDPLHFTNQLLNVHPDHLPSLDPVLRFRPLHAQLTNERADSR